MKITLFISALAFTSGYSEVNGITLYYEMHGQDKAPMLIHGGGKGVVTPEHALELHRQTADSELAIIPGGHGEYIGEITTLKPETQESTLAVPLIETFLNKH